MDNHPILIMIFCQEIIPTYNQLGQQQGATKSGSA